MQTFLPYSDYELIAVVLDPKRLGNQCYREVKTLLNGGWPHHPASKMWRGYEYSLCMYGKSLAFGLVCNGKEKTGWKWFDYYINRSKDYPDTGDPPWMGREDVHASHRSNLLRKNFAWYSQWGWSESPDLPYVWPV